MTAKARASATRNPSRWLVVCRVCDKVIAEEPNRKDAFHQAFRHAIHGNDEVLLVDVEAKLGTPDGMTRGGTILHRRARGEAPGGPVVARILAPKTFVQRPYAVVCDRCGVALGSTTSEAEAFALAHSHKEHPDREVLVINRLVDVGDRHVVTRSGLLVSVRGEGEPDGGRWQGLLEAESERKTA